MIIPPPPTPPYVAPDLRGLAATRDSVFTTFRFRHRHRVQVVERLFDDAAWMAVDGAPLELRIHRSTTGVTSGEQVFYDSGDRGTATAAEVSPPNVATEPVTVDNSSGDGLGAVPGVIGLTVRSLTSGKVALRWTGPLCAMQTARLDDPTGPAARDLDWSCNTEDGFGPFVGFATSSFGHVRSSGSSTSRISIVIPIGGEGDSSWQLGQDVGIDRGWAAQPHLPEERIGKLAPGRYSMTVTFDANHALGEAGPGANSVTTRLIVRQRTYRSEQALFNALYRSRARAASHRPGTPTSHTARHTTPTLREARALPITPSRPAGARAITPLPGGVDAPDLRSAPAFGISVHNGKRLDLLRFSALEWNDGPGPMEVEAFRTGSSSTLAAYQVFFSGWDRVTRQARGTMVYDHEHGHHHFHFAAFARYSLVRSTSDAVVAQSGKRSWCLAPTDLVDSTRPGYTTGTQAAQLELACGNDSFALWARQHLDVGWGDTYTQDRGGQAFSITDVPNGTYRLKIEVNPDQALGETDYTNNVAYRTVTLSGKKHHRKVRVAADPVLGRN